MRMLNEFLFTIVYKQFEDKNEDDSATDTTTVSVTMSHHAEFKNANK